MTRRLRCGALKERVKWRGSLDLASCSRGAAGYWWWQGRLERSQDGPIRAAAQRYGVEPALIKAVVWRESRFHPRARGRAEEIGLMQLQEEAAREWAERRTPSRVRARALLRSRHQHAGGHLVSEEALAPVRADGQSAALRAGRLQRGPRQRAQVEPGRGGDEQRCVHRANRLPGHQGLCEVSDAPLCALSAAFPSGCAQTPTREGERPREP